MEKQNLKEIIEAIWHQKEACDLEILELILSDLDQGRLRVVEKKAGTWHVHTWIKQAILLYFKHKKAQLGETGSFPFFDKIPLKCAGWTTPDFETHAFRLAPGAIIRWGSFISPHTIIMPSFINTGVFIGEGTMIDSHVRVGSCAQIGKNCHLSDAVGIGGVLEPPQAQPVIIEDHCFIGARAQIVEGVLVEEGAVLGMGVMLGASTKIIDRATGQITYGRIPAYSVVVPGAYAHENNPLLSTSCAIIVKQVDKKTRQKVAINELLRT